MVYNDEEIAKLTPKELKTLRRNTIPFFIVGGGDELPTYRCSMCKHVDWYHRPHNGIFYCNVKSCDCAIEI